MNTVKKYIDLGVYLSLIFIAVTFPLPYKISNLGIVALVVFWFAKKVVNKEGLSFNFSSKYDRLVLIAFWALFLWEAISLSYAENVAYGLKNIEGKLSLVLLPLVLYDLKLEVSKLISLLKYYIYSLAICTIVLLGQSITHYLQEGSLLTYHDFTRSLDFHAVFYSYYIFLSILISAFLYLKKMLSKQEKLLMTIALVLSFVGLIISASKNVLVVTTLFLIVGMIIRAVKSKIGWKEITIALAFIVVGGIGISQVTVIKNRIAEITQLNGMENYAKIKRGEKLVAEDIPKFNGTSLRITFWDVGINKLIEKDRFLIGLTPGDRRTVLNEEFFKNGLNPWYENYNIHNQFVQTLVELGLIGLVLYLLIHIGCIIIAIREDNFLLLTFIIGLIIFQMTESIIERNKGIVFVIFFLLLLKQFNQSLSEGRYIRD